MTEKRFEIIKSAIIDGARVIKDNEKKYTFATTFETATLINYRKALNELYEENEQLKQQIQQLKHWNRCLAEKRHQELSYGYYTDSKAEKRVKDLFEHKPLNCSDRIKSDRYD